MSARPETLDDLLAGDPKACCASLYEHPWVRWLLGGELHPGGAATTRRALELISVGRTERLLDVASGAGDSALLAARELGCDVVGIDYGSGAVAAAKAAATVEDLDGRVSFVEGDAEALPFADGEFDAVLCECSLCTFADKGAAVGEMRRVLRPGGRVAIADVVAERDRLPAELRGAMATVACVGDALPLEGYIELLMSAGVEPFAAERHDSAARALAARVEDRLRGARLLGADEFSPLGIGEAIELAGLARRAIERGTLGYAILAGHLREH